MDTDLALTVGILLMVLSVPSLLSAWADSRPPRMGSVMVVAAAALVLMALWLQPGGYAFSQIPDVMVVVISRLFD